MSTEDALNYVIRSQVDLLRLDAGTQRKVVALLEIMEKELLQAIAEVDPAKPKLTKWKQHRLKRLTVQSNNIIRGSYGDIDKTVDKDLYKLAGYETENAAVILNKSVGANIFDVTYTSAQLKTLVDTSIIDGDTIGGWWREQSRTYQKNFNRTMKEVTEQIAIGVLKGESIGELTKRVKGTKDIAGLTKGADSAAKSLTRTAFMEVAQKSRRESYDSFEEVMRGYQYIATLDNRTTPYCRAADGKIYNMEYLPVGHNFPLRLPPAHWQCRSTLLPLVKTWAQLAGPDALLSKKQISNVERSVSRTQRPMIGRQIKGKVFYNTWLKKQTSLPKGVKKGSPEAKRIIAKGIKLQEEVLGVKKRELWAKGKITLPDMVDQTGRPLLIEELQKLIKERG